MNFFIADVQDGLGAYLGVFLKQHDFMESQIGLISTTASLCALLFAIPLGIFIDKTPHKKALIAFCIIAIVFATLANYFYPHFGFTLLAQMSVALCGVCLAPAFAALTLARDYYFNFNLSYGPGFLGWMSKIYEDKNRYFNALQKLKSLGQDKRLQNLSVECASFEKVFETYPKDFFYCDPPYFLEGDSQMFKGIYPMRNFPIHHNRFNHALLAELLKNHKGKFILSYNDCAFVREAYKDFRILEPKWQYTMGQGETRVGKNRIERGDKDNIKQSHELLIIKE